MNRQPTHNIREIIAGCRMPSSKTIEIRDVQRQSAAEYGSSRLLRALYRYGARHGLPNLSPAWCAEQLPPTPPPERPKNTRRDTWTQAEDELILSLRAKNFGYGTIARSLPGRSDSAVSSRLRLLRQRSGALQ